MELIVLGAAGTWPPPGGANCGYLLRHEGTHVWIDAGTGTFANLQEHVGVGEISTRSSSRTDTPTTSST